MVANAVCKWLLSFTVILVIILGRCSRPSTIQFGRYWPGSDCITMILAVAATEFEMSPFVAALNGGGCATLTSGVGPVESCLSLTRFLCKKKDEIAAVVNFGVAGAYLDTSLNNTEILDIYFAEADVLGDLGICFPRRLDDLSRDLIDKKYYELDRLLLQQAFDVLAQNGVACRSGRFVTVSCASGTRERGELLRKKYDAVCETMEGAAIARVCVDFGLPLVQMRCISNYVEDRNPDRWRLLEACAKCAKTAALLIDQLE